jgi:HK97 family phage prohead protease
MNAAENPMNSIKTCSFVAEVKALDDPMQVSSIVSTASIDRMGDVVCQDGWELDNYRQNPVVLINHDYAKLPVGKCVSIDVKDGRLMAVTQFADTQMGREVAQLYRGGFMRSFSVGFRPLEWEPLKGSKGFKYTKNELLEYSCVVVPANQEATMSMRSLIQRGVLRECVPFMPPGVAPRESDAIEDFARGAVRKMDLLNYPRLAAFLSRR